MGNRYRWWYRMTGLPGWMRFGFSPGWLGWSPTGVGPAAQYLMHGYWPTPQMNNLWQSGQVPFASGPGFSTPGFSTPGFPMSGFPMSGFPMPGFPTPYDPYGAAAVTPEQELDMLKGQAEILEDELQGIKNQIAELEKKDVPRK